MQEIYLFHYEETTEAQKRKLLLLQKKSHKGILSLFLLLALSAAYCVAVLISGRIPLWLFLPAVLAAFLCPALFFTKRTKQKTDALEKNMKKKLAVTLSFSPEGLLVEEKQTGLRKWYPKAEEKAIREISVQLVLEGIVALDKRSSLQLSKETIWPQDLYVTQAANETSYVRIEGETGLETQEPSADGGTKLDGRESYPVFTKIFEKAKQIAAGRYTLAVITEADSLLLWGDNSHGQCGQKGEAGAYVKREEAVQVPGEIKRVWLDKPELHSPYPNVADPSSDSHVVLSNDRTYVQKKDGSLLVCGEGTKANGFLPLQLTGE